MGKHALFFCICFIGFVCTAFGQNNIKKNASIPYTLGPPTYTVNLASSSEIAIDSSTGKIYQYHRTTSSWLQIGQGIDVISGTIAPAYTPARNMSKFAINADNELYYYTGGSWVLINGGTGGGGHVILEGNTPRAQKDSMEFQSNTSIVLAATNTATRTVVEATIETNAVGSAEIAADAVGNSELAANAVDSSNVVNGGLSVLDLGQHGASSGQVLKWNGTQWAPGTDNNSGGTITGSGAAGEVAYFSGAGAITSEAALNYDATNNRLGINKSSPAVKLDIQTANSSDGIRVQSDGTADQDVWGIEFAGTATGSYVQRGRISLDVFSNAGASPDGESMVFTLSRDAGNTYTPLLLYRDQAVMNNSAGFTIANNSGRLRFQSSSAGIYNTGNNWLLTNASFTTNDAATRLKLVGSTQTSASWSFRAFDGNAQSIFQIRDDSKVGILATTLDAALTINGAGATAGTYGLMVTPSGGTTATGTLVVRDDNRVGIRTNAPQAPLNVVGTGTGSGTTALLVEGSGGQDNLNVRDDGVVIGQGLAMTSSAPTIAFGTGAGTGPVNDLCVGGANGFSLSFTTGTSPAAGAAIFTATLPKSYPNGVVCTTTCGTDTCLDKDSEIRISGTSNNSVTLTMKSGSSLVASTAYTIHTTCIGY